MKFKPLKRKEKIHHQLLKNKLFYAAGLCQPFSFMIKSAYIFAAFTGAFSLSYFTFHAGYSYEPAQIVPDTTISVSFTAVGDLMCHSPQYEYARITADSFNFAPMFEFVKDSLSKADFTLGNLETVIGGKELGYSGYPFFNSPDDYLRGIKETGFDVLFYSNNHSFDKGEKGVLRTIQKLKESEFYYAGANETGEDKDSTVLILDKGGVRIAVLSFTYGLNGNYVPKGKEYLVNVIDTTEIKRQIELARYYLADVVITYFHFGEEYKTTPNNFQQTMVDKAVSYGADIILGSHPHVLQKYEWKKSSSSVFDSVLVVYSMGNFISNQRKRYTDCGVIVNFAIEKNLPDNKYTLKNLSFEPTWVFRGYYNGEKTYKVLPSRRALSDTTLTFLSKEDRKSIAESLTDTEEILNLKPPADSLAYKY